MAFSSKTLDFLQENSFRDSKEWFHEHKPLYEEYVTEPFYDFIRKMEPGMKRIDDQIICDVRKLARIYRDTRFSKNKSIFRADLWYSFGRLHSSDCSVPEFFFDISPDGYTYGCGYFQAGTDRMDAARKLILAGDDSFLAAEACLKKQSVFQLSGEMYKKNHYPNSSEELGLWLNRRNLYVERFSMDFDTLYGDELPDIISKEFFKIKEFYHFLLKVEKLK